MTTTYRLFVFYSRGKCMQILFLEIIKIIFPYFIYSHELIYEYLQKTICRFGASQLTTSPPPNKTLSVKFFFFKSLYMHFSWKMRFKKKNWVAHRVKKVFIFYKIICKLECLKRKKDFLYQIWNGPREE